MLAPYCAPVPRGRAIPQRRLSSPYLALQSHPYPCLNCPIPESGRCPDQFQTCACTIKFYHWYLTLCLASPKGTQRILAPPPFAALVPWLEEPPGPVHPPRPLPPGAGSLHLLGDMPAFVSTEHTTARCDCCKQVRSLPHLPCTNSQGSHLQPSQSQAWSWSLGLSGRSFESLLAPLHGIRRSAWSLCLAGCMPT